MGVVDVYEMRAGGCRCCGPSVIIRMSEHMSMRNVRFEGVIEGEMEMWKCGKGVLGAFDLVGKKQEEVGEGGWVLGRLEEWKVDHGGIIRDRWMIIRQWSRYI